MSVFRQGTKGFTLTEIMVVTAIITLILGIALPNFTRMKANASEAAVMRALTTLSTAFEEFWQDQTPHRYPRNLAELDSIPAVQGSPEYVSENLSRRPKYQGYYFSAVSPSANTYSIQATPTNPTVSGPAIYAIGSDSNIPSGAIIVCPSGNTEGKFKLLANPKPACTIEIHEGHPKDFVEIPAESK